MTTLLSVTGTRGEDHVTVSVQIDAVTAHERRHILSVGRMFHAIDTASLSVDDKAVIAQCRKNGWFVDNKKIADRTDTLTPQAKKEGKALSDATRDSGPDLSVAYNALCKANFEELKPRTSSGRGPTKKVVESQLNAMQQAYANALREAGKSDEEVQAALDAVIATAQTQAAAREGARVGDKVNASDVPSAS